MKSRVRAIVLTVLPTLVVLAAVEMLGRIAVSVEQDIAAKKSPAPLRWLMYSENLGWERRPGFKGNVGHADREFDAAGYFAVDSRQVASSGGGKRVIFLGDSNTFGFGAETPDSFVEVADRLLPDVDMINLGVVGYSSYQGRRVLEKYIPLLKPDLVVVSFNFNDRRYATPPDEADGPQEFQRVYRSSESVFASVARVMETSYAYRGLRRALRRIWALPQPVNEVNVTGLRPRVDESSYHRNLALMAENARQSGIPVLFVLLRDDPMQSDHLRKGVARLDGRDYELAIAYLNSAVRSRSMFSELARLYLVKAYDSKNDAAKSAEAAVIQSTYRSFSGGTLIRLDTDYNDIMRKVAVENNMPLLDGAAILETDPSVFIDFCHFNADGHRMLGTALATRISEILKGAKPDTAR